MNKYHMMDGMPPKKPGLMSREREVMELKGAAAAGSYQAKVRLRPAMSGLMRQQNVAEGRPAPAKRKGY